MAYATLAQIRAWLPEIESTNTDFDGELVTNADTNIQKDVTRDIDLIVLEYTTLPVLNTYVKTALADIEAEWCAARWRKRRPQSKPDEANKERITDIDEEAKRRCREILGKIYYGHTDFVGANRTIDNDGSRFMGPETR